MPSRKRKTDKKRRIVVIALVVLLLALSAVLLSPSCRSFVRQLPLVSQVEHFLFGVDPVIPEADAYGLDISRYQGDIDWKSLRQIHFDPVTRRQLPSSNAAAVSISFIFAKASEGATHVDSTIKRNRVNVRKLSIPFGAYHVLTLANSKAQAANFISNAKLRKGDLVPVIDLEEDILGSYANNRVKDTLINVAKRLARRYGHKPIIYGSHKYINRIGLPEGYPLWIARYRNGKCPQNADIWQFTDRGTVPGISQYVDINALYADRFRLSDYVLTK